MTDVEILERATDYVGIHYINGVEDPYINPCLLRSISSGIAALRREQERSQGCEYCREDREGYITKLGAFSIHKGELHCNGVKPRAIHYCYNCGRPLTEAESGEEIY